MYKTRPINTQSIDTLLLEKKIAMFHLIIRWFEFYGSFYYDDYIFLYNQK